MSRTRNDQESEQGNAAIEGSWDVPDVRATNNLSEFLTEYAGYIPVVANMGRMGRARLMVLRKEEVLRRQEEFQF